MTAVPENLVPATDPTDCLHPYVGSSCDCVGCPGQVTDRIRAELAEAEAAGINLGDEYLSGMLAALDQVDEACRG